MALSVMGLAISSVPFPGSLVLIGAALVGVAGAIVAIRRRASHGP
jgi:hypothetical protein